MNNKKITILFIITAVLLLLGIVGFTIAYFTSSTDFENEFNTGLYQTTATEVFESPQNWMPGDTTPKTLTITNTGSVDVKARVCITKDEWESANGTILPNEINGDRISIINLDNTDEWTYRLGCYEYNDILEPNETTSSFIQSVTFNPNVVMPEADVVCTTTTNNNETTKVCSSSGEGLSGATYTLKLTVETVQANEANKVWIPIYFVGRHNNSSVTAGDEMCIDTECFYVVSSDQNKTVLLAKHNLLVGDIVDYTNTSSDIQYEYIKTLSSSDEGYGLQNEDAIGVHDSQGFGTWRYIGVVPFSGTNYWDNSGCGYTSGEYSCSGSVGLLPEYSQNGETYDSTPHNTAYPNVYKRGTNTPAPQFITEANYNLKSAINNGYMISYYVDEYVETLKSLGAPESITGRLLTYEELSVLGCSDSMHRCNNLLDNVPELVYSGSYWLASAKEYRNVWFMNVNGNYSDDVFSSPIRGGVRPVIEIPTSIATKATDTMLVNGIKYTINDDNDEGTNTINNIVNPNVNFYSTAASAMNGYLNGNNNVIYPYYLKHIISGSIINESYIELIIDDEMASNNPGLTAGTYSFRGGVEGNEIYASNKSAALAAMGSSNCIEEDNTFTCEINDFQVVISIDGQVGVGKDFGCTIDSNGKSYCGENK